MPSDAQKPAANPLGTRPVGRLLMQFSIPSIISFLVSALYNIVDQIFIGQGVGLLGNAATNVAFPLTTISTALALLIGIGTAANFNLNLGAGRQDRAREIAGSGIVFLVSFGVLLGVVVLLFLRPLLIAFGATEDVFPYARTYTGITAFGLPLLIFSTGASHLIRADGSPTYSMTCTLSGAILNTILDPLFIFGFDMGIAGGALATVLGQILSAVLAARYLLRYRLKSVGLTRQSMCPQAWILRTIVSLGMAPCFNQLAMTVVQITMNNTLTYYGALSPYGKEIPLACVGVISKVNILMMGFTIGIAQGCQPIFSFNYGARNYHRVRATFRRAVILGLIICTAFFACFQLFPRQIVSIFGEGSELYYQFAEEYFRIYMFMAFANGLHPLISNFFTAIGRAKMGILISLTRQIIFLIPLILIFPAVWGIDGVMYAGPIADGAALLLAIFLSWREMRRVSQAERLEIPPDAP